MRWINPLLAVLAFAAALPGQSIAMTGEQALEQSRCTACHSIGDGGSRVAPDLASRPSQPLSPAALAALLWNHGPAMWAEMERRNMPVPQVSDNQARAIFAWFYGLRFFDPPGDAGRGRRLFASKGCAGCHSLEAAASGPAPPVASWTARGDLIGWTSAMWHHAAPMQPSYQAEGIEWSRLSEQEITDLLLYIQSLRPDRDRKSVAIGSPEEGRRLFSSKGCDGCHTLGKAEGRKRDLAVALKAHRGLMGLAAAMWNHRPLMQEAAEERKQNLPAIDPGQMADLLAYLWEEGYGAAIGSTRSGRRVFQSKGCARCHESGPGPKLTSRASTMQFWDLAAAFWRHGPGMLKQMRQQGIEWPTFNERQMRDLLTYLNSSLSEQH